MKKGGATRICNVPLVRTRNKITCRDHVIYHDKLWLACACAAGIYKRTSRTRFTDHDNVAGFDKRAVEVVYSYPRLSQ